MITIIGFALLTLYYSGVNGEYEQNYQRSFPDHEIEIEESDIEPDMVFKLEDVNLRRPETYGIHMEQVQFPSYDTGYYFENAPYEHEPILDNDIRPVVENMKDDLPLPSSLSSAHAVSYEQHYTPKGLTSSVTHHGGKGNLKSPHFLTSGSFSYQGRTFKY